MTKPLGMVTAMGLESGALPGGIHSIPARKAPDRRTVRQGRLHGVELLWIRSGPGFEAAHSAAEALTGMGVQGLMCLGVSGGLAPGLDTADLVLADGVLLESPSGRATFPLALHWPRRAWTALQGLGSHEEPQIRVRLGRVLSLDRPALGMAHKESLWHRTRALAVDMESGGVAQVATEAGLPLLVLRAVCDPCQRNLPPELPRLLDDQGHVGVRRLAASVLRKPGLIPAMWTARREFNAALESLSMALEALGRGGALLPG